MTTFHHAPRRLTDDELEAFQPVFLLLEGNARTACSRDLCMMLEHNQRRAPRIKAVSHGNNAVQPPTQRGCVQRRQPQTSHSCSCASLAAACATPTTPGDAFSRGRSIFHALVSPQHRLERHVFYASAPLRAVFLDISAILPGRNAAQPDCSPVGMHLAAPQVFTPEQRHH